MTVQSIHRVACASAIVLLAGWSAGCGDVAREGRSPVQLVITSLVGIPGDSPGAKSNAIISDVQTQVTKPDPCTTDNPCTTTINDMGEVTFSLILKDPGQGDATPTSLNAVTITRYHVAFVRSDGRNTQGVDVPYAFDGAATATVTGGSDVALDFDLVRHNAKKEQPLIQLVCASLAAPPLLNGGGACPPMISTIATITFYGRDQAGNDVSVTGSMSVTFGDVIRAS